MNLRFVDFARLGLRVTNPRLGHLSGVLIAGSLLALIQKDVCAMDFSNGKMVVVPVKNGQPPKIDGDLSDFDTTAAEPMYIAEQTVRQMNSEWVLNYDSEALYIGVRNSLPGRALHNPSNPQDAFWSGDLVQMRMSVDPTLPHPLDSNRDKENDRIAHISLWKNTETGQDFIHINRGTQLNLGQEANPPGSQIVIRTEGKTAYTIEARIPWSALHAPGGRNPFAPGGKGAIVLETVWVGGDAARVAGVYGKNPGTFAFNQPATWGQAEYVAQSPTARLRPTIASLIDRFSNAGATVQVGVPFEVQVPEDGLKVSVNILGPQGEVIRELMGGEPRPRGPVTLRWDGKDQFGRPMPPGPYRWGAYMSRGLRAEFIGGVGKSGTPYYETEDGRGGWGADHSDPIDTAADNTGMYFLWPVGEASRPVVKTDYNGRVLWRRNPFVGGGFGPFYAITANDKFVYLIIGESNVRLVRLDAATGQLLTWGEGGPTELPLFQGKEVKLPAERTAVASHDPHAGAANNGIQPEASGLAIHGNEIFVPVYSQDKILVCDAATGKVQRELACPAPRGIAVSPEGHLLAVSYLDGQPGRVLRFNNRDGAGVPVISTGLEAPWDVAADKSGRIYVSDLGASQQVKVFDGTGKLVQARGRRGGRTRNGAYTAEEQRSFLHPAGVAVDAQGQLLVVEAAIPKIISRFDANGGLVKRWFGTPTYWAAAFPDPQDPRQVIYQLSDGLGRARVEREAENPPNAYWSLSLSGYEGMGSFNGLATPTMFIGQNRRKYLLDDHDPHTLSVVENDRLRPVAFARVNREVPGDSQARLLELWTDVNNNGKAEPEEIVSRSFTLRGTKVHFHSQTQSGYMEPNGDLYLLTQNNAILRVPSTGFAPNGAPRWNLQAADFVIPFVMPSKGAHMGSTWRHGLLGVRRDATGNFYVCFNTRIGGSGAPFEYATPELEQQMLEGMGHTATFNAVKFAKYDPQGRLLWMTGRKATAGAKPGEIYHFWQMAGLVERRPGQAYVAGGSEWGRITFYTNDGFYVDGIMNDPGQNTERGPYTFGGETNSGRVQYFPERDEVWAYAVGMAYKVHGFRNGQVEGERRISGTVNLDRVYEAPPTTTVAAKEPLQLTRVAGDAFAEAGAWTNVPTSTLQRNNAELATAQLAYNDQFLFGRIHVRDESPLQNSTDTVHTAFKGGDTAGIVLGPDGQRNQAGAGDVRIMAAMVGGRPRLIAMKSATTGEKRPFQYTTPATGTVNFEFVDEVPGGRVNLVADADGKGYTATFAVPRNFLEFELAPGAQIAGDIEVRLSGNGQRGLQATSRNYLFTPSTPSTTMTDDVPTEARIYREFFGPVQVRD